MRKILPLLAMIALLLIGLSILRHRQSRLAPAPTLSIGTTSAESSSGQHSQVSHRPMILQAQPNRPAFSPPIASDGFGEREVAVDDGQFETAPAGQPHLHAGQTGDDQAEQVPQAPSDLPHVGPLGSQTAERPTSVPSPAVPSVSGPAPTGAERNPLEQSSPPAASGVSESSPAAQYQSNVNSAGAQPENSSPPSGAVEQQNQGQIAGQRIYVVRQGETLVDIARRELGQGARWMEIYRLNHQQLGGQIHNLPSGLRLVLPQAATH